MSGVTLLNTRQFFTRIPSLPDPDAETPVTRDFKEPRAEGGGLPPTAVTRFKTVNEAEFFEWPRSGMTPGADFERRWCCVGRGGLRVT